MLFGITLGGAGAGIPDDSLIEHGAVVGWVDGYGAHENRNPDFIDGGLDIRGDRRIAGRVNIGGILWPDHELRLGHTTGRDVLSESMGFA